jgi:hypothetical protein
MTQVIDMRRLHMGCGESLQPHLPLPFYSKRRQTILTQTVPGRMTAKGKKTGREESR